MTSQSSSGYALFPTPIGRCGIAWRGKCIMAVQLPEATPTKTAAKLVTRCGGASAMTPPAWVQRVIERITLHLSGDKTNLASIAIDLTAEPPFHQRVYTAARNIPAGRTVTYGELAALAGSPGAARAVGQALARNPFPILVPCHRVLASDNTLGGFTAHRGKRLKRQLLALEDLDRS